MYYNPETKETAERSNLKKKYNVSIPETTEEYNGWYLLNEGERPQSSRNNKVIKGEISEVDGKYYQTYVLETLSDDTLKVHTRMARNRYLEEYVDNYVNNVLKWNDLSEEEQSEISNYRRYLLDYPQQEGDWWLEDPKRFEEWKIENEIIQ